MRRIADVGAAVIGTGFIGTVHVEALRRIGVQVRGVLGSTPERGAARATPSASRAPTTRSPTSCATRSSRSSTSPRPTTSTCRRPSRSSPPAGTSSARSRWRCPPRSRAELVDAAARPALVNAANFNIRYYPLNQHAHDVVAGGEIGDVRLVTGRYFQDWLLLESDWNWRLQPDRGGALRAVGDIGSHWLDLMTFVTGQRVVAVMADLATFIEARQRADRARSRPSRPTSRRDRHPPDRDGGRRDDPPALRERRPRGGEHQPDQRRTEELAPVRDRRLDLVDRLGFRAAGPDLARPSRATERDPHPEPGAHGPVRAGRGRPAGRSRRGLRRHLRGAFPRGLRRRRRGRPVRAIPRYPTFADGHDEMLVNDAIAESARAGSLGRRRPRPGHRRRDPPPRRRTSDETRSADRSVPRDPA